MINRLGETNYNRYGSKMTIVEYNNASDIVVEFDNGYKINTQYRAFIKGVVKNVYDKSVYGVGFIGEGHYTVMDKNGNKTSKQYNAWSSMLERCYHDELKKRHPSYIDCTSVEEWHNFQKFSKWYDENYYEIEGQKMHLDKDILNKKNKIYSPKTCVFVPQRINSLFTKREQSRNIFIGVHYNKGNSKYQAKCSDVDGKQRHIGYYDTPQKAFFAYKSYKEAVIKEVANNYIDRIPEKLYSALMKYEVEIDD
ncbi:HNH endonuclease [Bacillus phage vB_BanS_Skywalker]|uniref:DNA-binding domain protein n=2 Tax=Tsamsavirus TaxID=3044849 RepID=A0AAE8YWW8_9CAUD|nr:HNH endonuclease [Bacillus phage vB_BanS_Skywalker]YP_010680903.1 HNH endonuclease [Bacillus phage vB_BanS_MrDarsey]UGO47839.1 DNA-binding domain protein [Bacillus phage vB_BanS_MrDarsey]UGO51408.1 DNA-binding domain protein [Bacillus phage vB_BanS_Skywalker]